MTGRVNSNPTDIWTSVGYPFNQAVAEPDGRRVHVTGQVAWDRAQRLVGEGDAERQTDLALENIRKILASLGRGLDDVVSLTTLYLKADDIPGINRARTRAFRKETGPASTSYQVSGFVFPGILVEIQAVAVISEDRFRSSANS